jgi:hypothetical protein
MPQKEPITSKTNISTNLSLSLSKEKEIDFSHIRHSSIDFSLLIKIILLRNYTTHRSQSKESTQSLSSQ